MTDLSADGEDRGAGGLPKGDAHREDHLRRAEWVLTNITYNRPRAFHVHLLSFRGRRIAFRDDPVSGIESWKAIRGTYLWKPMCKKMTEIIALAVFPR
jgi:hypothetical protein